LGSFDRFFVDAARRLIAEVESGQLSVADLKLGDDARVVLHAEFVVGDSRSIDPLAQLAPPDPNECPACGSHQVTDGGDTYAGAGAARARVPNMVDRLCVSCHHRFSVPA
jgi:hypothetical protein